MINTHNRVPVYAYGAPAICASSSTALSGLVRNEMKKDPLSGALYLFTNR